LIYFPIQAIRGERVKKFIGEIQEFHERQFLEKRDVQWQKLLSLLGFVNKNNKYYRQLFEKNGIDINKINHPDDIQKIPYLTKDDLKMYWREMVSRNTGRVSMRKTSGSTGIPLEFVKDRTASAYMDALMYEVYSWHGIGIGDRQGRLWGIPFGLKGRLYTKFKDVLLNRRRLSAFNISRESSRDYFDELRRFRPKFIYALPSTLSAFAARLMDLGVDASETGIQVIITTGEVLFPKDRQTISNVFKCKVVNEYGATESGIVAFECSAGKLRQMMHNLYIEVIDQVSGKPTKPGETGEIIITELHSYGMPFIRYRVGDLAVPGEECSDKSTDLPIFESIVGRNSELIVTPEGKQVAAAILDYSLTKGVRRFKAYQRSVNLLHVVLVTDRDFDKQSLTSIEKAWRQHLGDNMKIDFEIADNIPPDSSGKMTVLVSELDSGKADVPSD